MIWPLSFSSPKSKKSLFSLFLRSMIISSVRASHFLAAKNLFFVSAGASSFLLPAAAAAAAAAARSFPPLSCLFSPKETLFSFHHLSSLSKCTRINICCQVVFQKKKRLAYAIDRNECIHTAEILLAATFEPRLHKRDDIQSKNTFLAPMGILHFGYPVLGWCCFSIPDLPARQAMASGHIAGTPTPPPISYT